MIKILAVSGIAALALAGCGSTVTGTSDAPGSTDAATGNTGNPQLGGSATFSDGVQVTTSKPQTFKPSQYAAKGKGQHFTVTFTLKNGGTDNYDPTLFHATANAAGSECEIIIDTEKKVDNAPQTTLTPGRTVTFKQGWSCDAKSGSELTMDVNPGISDAAIFTGKLP